MCWTHLIREPLQFLVAFLDSPHDTAQPPARARRSRGRRAAADRLGWAALSDVDALPLDLTAFHESCTRPASPPPLLLPLPMSLLYTPVCMSSPPPSLLLPLPVALPYSPSLLLNE